MTEKIENFELSIKDGQINSIHGLNPDSANEILEMMQDYLDACSGSLVLDEYPKCERGLINVWAITGCYFPIGLKALWPNYQPWGEDGRAYEKTQPSPKISTLVLDCHAYFFEDVEFKPIIGNGNPPSDD